VCHAVPHYTHVAHFAYLFTRRRSLPNMP
jgi:hypothetical protein